MAITYTTDPDTAVIEFTVSEHISKEDYETVIEPMQDFIDTHGTVRMIEIVESFPSFDPAILLPGIRFDIRNIRHISHVAVVSDIGWFSPVVRAAGALISSQMRTFPMEALDEARDWVRTADR